MQKVSVDIKNCYGIRSLEATFDFSKKKANIVYAPNGMIKTSFARTFKDFSNGIKSVDRIYPDREPTQDIVDENGDTVVAEEVFVIEPYISDYESTRISSLLVNKNLKKEYDQILKNLDSKQKDLVKLLREASGLKTGIETAISMVLTKEPDNFLRALERVRTEVNEENESRLAEVPYSAIFNDKVEKFLLTKDFKDKLQDYTNNYDELLSNSAFFRKGIFNHYQAGEIAKQLKNHGFFKADHTVYLNTETEKKEITSEEQLEAVINEEMQSILSDPKLRKSFDEIDGKLKANVDLRAFREFMLENMSIIPELTNPELFKEKLWKAYLVKHRDVFSILMDEFDTSKKRLQDITNSAEQQATKWQEVINIFNRRFSVPFKVSIENKQDVILKRNTPNLVFQFEDEEGAPGPVERDQLINILSNGERRALYILNIIFEVEARKEANIPTLFVVDDIADSFDYKNKYAIVEYLHDILHEGDFRQIILTHNYDFYRTIWKRLDLSGANYHVSRNAAGIQLLTETMYRDPFEKWKNSAKNPDRTDMLIAMIPFVRNLADYCGFADESDILTNLLHIKPGTDAIKVKNLAGIFGKVLNGYDFNALEGNEMQVKQLIFDEAQKITDAAENMTELEQKVVLAIAIRLQAENFLIDKISDETFVAAIRNNQTSRLIKKYKDTFENEEAETENIRLMERVNLMTPENIHLNSFMFEPILDMSAEHLTQLYGEVTKLNI
ncbi:MAG: phage infection protein [Devosiaceae bacterium]|nr:phage infection protein [Devosiaceae bacterium]